jgi:ribosome-associated protein
LADDRCHQVTVLDVSAVSPVTDYFVVATGTSGRQMRTAADAVEELGKGKGHGKLSRAGDESANWIIVDCFDVVVHVFTRDARSYYDVDGLWGDAKRVEWERPGDRKESEDAPE